LAGLVKMIRFKNPVTGNTCEATLSIVFNKRDDAIFYMYLDELQSLFDDAAREILKLEMEGVHESKIKEEVESFDKKVRDFLEEIRLNEMESSKEEVTKADKGLTHLKAKLVVTGAPAVGKTSLILRFTSNAFTRTYLPTLGVQLSQKVVNYKQYNIVFSIWDLAGQERFLPFMQQYYKGSNAEIIVFDLTRPETFRGVHKWCKDIQKHLSRPPIGIIIGNKNDLEEYRKITKEESQKLQEELGLSVYEASALTGSQVEAAFMELAEILVIQFEKDLEDYNNQQPKTG
ncbi:MAG: GTP-binding protein, partial [Candidatus Hodarchaeota archaeon]